MALDSRLLDSWIDLNGINLIKQDRETGDGLWYLTGPAADYSMPDAGTLIYPVHDNRLYQRVDISANQTIIGRWRHDKDPAVKDDVGEDLIFRKDGVYVWVCNGEALFYNGSYSVMDNATTNKLSIVEYRARLATKDNGYVLEAVWDFRQEGTFAFSIDSHGNKIVTFSPVDGSPSWSLTEFTGQALADPATLGAVRRDAITKRRGY